MSDPMNEQPPVVEQPPQDAELQKQLQEFHNGANWFYWIAGLSVVNSLLIFFGTGWAFIFGLGITQFVDGAAGAIGEEMGGGTGAWVVRAIGLGFSIAVAAVFALIGWLANKGYGAAFIFGMVIYVLDALVFIAAAFLGAPDWLGLAFHALALFFMFRGYSALRQLKTVQPVAA